MAFNGCYFRFDGISCKEYGLRLYGMSQLSSDEVLHTGTDIVEDRTPNRYGSFFYGTVANTPLQFNLTFGIDIGASDKRAFLSRLDLNDVASWLVGHNEYKYLEIEQPDMEEIRYRCIITNLRHSDIGGGLWGFTCTVTCDSPYAYHCPKEYRYEIDGSETVRFYNACTCLNYYKPKIIISPDSAGTFSIKNESDDGRITKLTNLPAVNSSIVLDSENEVITCTDIANPYSYFNFKFFRLVRGMNILTFTGSGVFEMICEYPVIVGG